jgi:hypothetical protein
MLCVTFEISPAIPADRSGPRPTDARKSSVIWLGEKAPLLAGHYGRYASPGHRPQRPRRQLLRVRECIVAEQLRWRPTTAHQVLQHSRWNRVAIHQDPHQRIANGAPTVLISA